MREEIITIITIAICIAPNNINASFLCDGNSEYNLNMDSIVIILYSRKNILLCNYYDFAFNLY